MRTIAGLKLLLKSLLAAGGGVALCLQKAGYTEQPGDKQEGPVFISCYVSILSTCWVTYTFFSWADVSNESLSPHHTPLHSFQWTYFWFTKCPLKVTVTFHNQSSFTWTVLHQSWGLPEKINSLLTIFTRSNQDSAAWVQIQYALGRLLDLLVLWFLQL